MSFSNHQSLEDFEPNEKIIIGNTEYIFEAHPCRTNRIDLRPGGQGFVAKLRKKENGQHFAIKSFNYRDSSIVERCNVAEGFSEKTPGMKAAKIEVVNPNLPIYAYTVSSYPFLEYAVLMPWLPYPTWTDLRSSYGRENYPLPNYRSCRKRALNLANLLNLLWTHSTAHCDICPNNIIIGQNDEVYLIDFENIYHSSLRSLGTPPWGYPFGQDGYRHQYVERTIKGQWCLNGDLFGGALLISELLTWYDSQVREHKHSFKEKYIDQASLHDTTNDAFKTLRKSLQNISQECADLFYQAWISKNLDECPTMETWVNALVKTPESLTASRETSTHSVTRVKRPRPGRTPSTTTTYRTTEQKRVNGKTKNVSQPSHVSGRRPTKRKARISQHVKGRRPPGQSIRQPVPQVKTGQVSPRVSTSPQRSTSVTQPSQATSSAVTIMFTVLFVLLLIAVCIGIGIWVFS